MAWGSIAGCLKIALSWMLRTVSWGTLLITLDKVELAPFAVIDWVLSLRKL